VELTAGAAKDISNDVTSFDVSTPRGVFDVTGMDKSAVERILGLSDGKVTLKGVFNTAADMSHDVFKTVPVLAQTSRATVLTYPGAKTLTLEILYEDYAISRGADGSLTWTATGSLADGVAPLWA
jgi:hypothetical protein